MVAPVEALQLDRRHARCLAVRRFTIGEDSVTLCPWSKVSAEHRSHGPQDGRPELVPDVPPQVQRRVLVIVLVGHDPVVPVHRKVNWHNGLCL